MKYQYVLILLIHLCFHTSYAQTTAIPDQNFEQALIDLGIDSDGVVNGEVATEDVENLTELNVGFYDIKDLTGIEDFVSLEILLAQYNLLEAIDLSNLENLRVLNLRENNFVSIDVSQNSALEEFYIGNPENDVTPLNNLQTLDLSNNPNLIILDCYFNISLDNLDLSSNPLIEELILPFCGLSSLDVSNNLNLKKLDLGFVYNPDPDTISNDLTTLDVSANVNLTDLHIASTTLRTVNTRNGIENQMVVNADLAKELECILVDDENAATAGTGEYENWNIPDAVTFSETECVLSVEENELAIVTLYPNPTQDDTTLEGITNIALETIHLYDVAGRKVSTQSDTAVISLRELPAGIYFAKLQLENGKVSTKRIVKR